MDAVEQMTKKERFELKALKNHYDNNRSVYEELGAQGAESYIEYYREKFPEAYERLHELSIKEEKCI